MTTPQTALDRLTSGKYLLLTTFRRDGRAVPTPVWVARDGDAIAVWTMSRSGKVKRIRNSGRVEVGPCDFRGRPSGESVAAQAELLPPEEALRYQGLMKRKYGFQVTFALLTSRLKRDRDTNLAIRIRLSD